MRYLMCKDRKIIGPYEPEDLVALPGFGEVSLVCPEDRSGLQPQDWQKAASAPDLRTLIRHGAPPAEAPAEAVPPAHGALAARRAEEEYKKILAAFERRIDLLESELARRAEPPVGHEERAERIERAERAPEAPGLERMHASVASLHDRLAELQEKLDKTHHLSRAALAELDGRTQQGLREVASQVQGLRAAPPPLQPLLQPAAPLAAPPARVSAPAAVAAPADDEGPDAPSRDKLHQRIMDHTAKSFGVDALCLEMGDYKAALGGVFTALAGFAGVIKGLVGLGLEAHALRTLMQVNDFLYALPNDKNSLTIVASVVAIGTGFHQIGSANNHAQILDNHAQMLDNHAQMMDSNATLSAQLGSQPQPQLPPQPQPLMPPPSPAPAPTGRHHDGPAG